MSEFESYLDGISAKIRSEESFLRCYAKTFASHVDMDSQTKGNIKWLRWNPESERLEVSFMKGEQNITRPLIASPWNIRSECMESLTIIKDEINQTINKIIAKAIDREKNNGNE